MGRLVDKTFNLIDKNRGGEYNSIPTGIEKFDSATGGIVPATMYLIGAETSVGKTAFAADKFIHGAFEYYKRINDPTKLDVLFVHFTLEIMPEYALAGAITRKLFLDYGRVVPIDTVIRKLGDEDRQILDVMKPYLEEFESKNIIWDDDLTPNKFHDFLMEIAKRVGKFEKEARWISECSGYTLNNPQLFIEIILDTVNLGETDSEHTTVKSTIDRLSRIAVFFRNKCGFIILFLQQFNAEISDVDRNRHGIKTPLLRDFEDSKRPTKDAEVVVGLYDPKRHMQEEERIFRGYDMHQLRSWFRSAHIMKNRRGENNKFIPMKFDGAVGLFSQLPDAKDMDQNDYIRATRH